ncbi:MAG: acetyl/propionyl/methylcrotonyl-CoA carboxylase subunit alpha [Salaquimonas sp.]
MFKKILIANRGEIACRIIKTAREMNVQTVAVYSEADASALHVKLADEAVLIGPAPVTESYLVKENIINAALATGAEAIHPGYGFLSENPDFVEAVEAAGLVFIGPSAKAIRSMGLKDAAKSLMQKAGVPVVPGYHGDVQEPGFLAAKANEIGYPVLIKARAGGGGKGMRRVDNPKDFSAALASCRSEARSSFGDDCVLLEKYILNPRHIEVQVFGDNHGNVVHLFERDCSLQRRHQKVIEEAPAPDMTDEMREAMTSAAVKAAEAIEYSGAGTIEFIVDGSGGLRSDGFWFMEMNTRLQVEHPVTEMVTGLDLVEWQLRVASGEPIPCPQESISLIGHAFEARLYAEDVPKGFLPAIGTLEHLSFPANVRIDTGVTTGDAISPFYDPMIAKVICYGDDRQSALGKLNAALQHTQIAGTVTNKEFLANLSSHDGFAKGEVDTGLIERDLELLIKTAPVNDEIIGIAAIINLMFQRSRVSNDPFDRLGGFSIWGECRDKVILMHHEDLHEVTVCTSNMIDFKVEHNGNLLEMLQCSINRSKQHLNLISNGKLIARDFAIWDGHIALFLAGACFTFATLDPLSRENAVAASSDNVVSPMPGLIKKLHCKAGDKVSRGEALLVLEAMKMEHTLNAPRDGVLYEVNISDGDQVLDGAVLISLEPEAEE